MTWNDREGVYVAATGLIIGIGMLIGGTPLANLPYLGNGCDDCTGNEGGATGTVVVLGVAAVYLCYRIDFAITNWRIRRRNRE